MKGVVMNGLIFIFLHAILAVEGSEDGPDDTKGSVEFWGTTVTLYCPSSYDGIKVRKTNNKTQGHELEIHDYTQKDDGQYDCLVSSSSQLYQFYIKGKVCDNCYELNTVLVSGVIVGDLMLTFGIMMIVYLYAQKKAGKTNSTKSVPAKPKSRTAGRGPPEPPATDYQTLNTVNRDTYAIVNKNG